MYFDETIGREVSTHSMLKTFQRCPKQAQYKYVERLKKKHATARDKPLRRGVWFHELMEVHYAGGDWKARHKQLSAKFSELFDEEKDALGDLPRELAALMRSYLWHYGANKDDPLHGWTVHEVELTLEAELPSGRLYRGRVDMLVEDEYGLWIVDHKTHKKLPDFTFRLLDYQSALYIWAAHQNKIPVMGFIWNYVRTKVPSVPALVDQKRTPRLSASKCDTDYPTLLRAIKEYGLDPRQHRDWLLRLKNQRWQPNEVQTSQFFQRHTLEKSDDMIQRVLRMATHTDERMHGYNFADVEAVERVVDRSCTYFCDYTDVCTTELFGGNAGLIRRQQFRVGDPLDYYKDNKETSDG